MRKIAGLVFALGLVTPSLLANAVTINITARQFQFSPASFSVNQGDVVTLVISVPSSDGSPEGHGFAMDTYVDGVLIPKGQSKQVTFTATTAGTFGFACIQSTCGIGHSSMSGSMVVNAVTTPAPSITSIFPNSGSADGGTTVTISGSNFQTSGTTTVKFDTAAASNVQVTSATSITASTPAHDAGAVDVTVTNPDGQSATASKAFTYNPAGPSITAVNPNTGSTAGGTAIAITGTGFQNGAAVKVGANAARNVVVGSSTNINALTPIGPATEEVGIGLSVTVTNPDGRSATMPSAFTYFVPPLAVVGISPATGLIGGGTVVTITGQGFTTAVRAFVTFGGVQATDVQVLDAVTLQATAPAHAAGSVDVVVTVGGASVTKSAAFTYAAPIPRRRSARH